MNIIRSLQVLALTLLTNCGLGNPEVIVAPDLPATTPDATNDSSVADSFTRDQPSLKDIEAGRVDAGVPQDIQRDVQEDAPTLMDGGLVDVTLDIPLDTLIDSGVIDAALMEGGTTDVPRDVPGDRLLADAAIPNDLPLDASNTPMDIPVPSDTSDVPANDVPPAEDIPVDAAIKPDVILPPMDAGVDVPPAPDVPTTDVPGPTDTGPRWTRPSIIAYLPFDGDTSGTVFTHHASSPTAFGTLLGGTYQPSFAAQGLQTLAAGDGVFANDSNVGNFGTQDFGIAAWVQLNPSGTSNRTIAAKRGAFAFRINTSGNPLFGDSFSTCSVIATTGITDSNPHFVAFTRIAGVGTLYLGLTTLASAPCAANLTSGNALYIFGSESGSTTNLPLNGIGDEFVIWPGTNILGLYCSSIDNAQRAGSTIATPAECR